MEEEQPKERQGITGRLDKIEDLVKYGPKADKFKKKAKQFKMPFKVRMGQKKFYKKSLAIVIYIMSNRNIKIELKEIKVGMIYVNEIFYNANQGFLFFYKGKPVFIINEGQTNPLSPKDFKDDTSAQKIIIRAIEAKEALDAKKPFGGKALIWIGILVIAVLYMLFANSGGA